MRRKTAYLSIAALFLFLQCGKSNPAGPSVVTSETWRLYDIGTQNHIDIILSKLSNSAVSAQGTFYYDFYGDSITGIMPSGTAAIFDSSVIITASGTASYPPTVSGSGTSSTFNLNMSGIFKDSVASGTWSIVFSDSSWQGWINPGRFSGRLQNGSGVTLHK